MNILIGIVALGISTAFGFHFSKKFKARQLFFEDFVLFLSFLKSSISFSAKKLAQVFQEFSCQSTDFERVNLTCLKNIENRSAVLVGKEDMECLEILSQEEQHQVFQLLSALGTSDRATQIATIEAFQVSASLLLEESKRQRVKGEPLMRKLGVCGGVFLAILCL